jgi:hypothetical protein
VTNKTQLKNRLEWQDKLADMPMRLTDEVSIADLVATKYKASHCRAYFVMGLYMLVMVGITVGYGVSQPRFFAGCLGCANDSEAFMVFTLIICACMMSSFLAFLGVPKREPRHPFMHQVRVELRDCVGDDRRDNMIFDVIVIYAAVPLGCLSTDTTLS